MKISIELYDTKITVEDTSDDFCADALKDLFSRSLVAAGFPPSVIDCDGGHYDYVADDEEVVKKGAENAS